MPQLLEYHFQDAPAPSDPPLTLNELELPDAIEVGFAKADEGAVDEVYTVTALLLHPLDQHPPVLLYARK
jgi:hypothetical protein